MYTLIAKQGRGRTADSPDKHGPPPGRAVGPEIATLSGVALDAVSGRPSQMIAIVVSGFCRRPINSVSCG
jgi:hypothetical protein